MTTDNKGRKCLIQMKIKIMCFCLETQEILSQLICRHKPESDEPWDHAAQPSIVFQLFALEYSVIIGLHSSRSIRGQLGQSKGQNFWDWKTKCIPTSQARLAEY